MDPLIENVLMLAWIHSDRAKAEAEVLKAVIEDVVNEIPQTNAVINQTGVAFTKILQQ